MNMLYYFLLSFVVLLAGYLLYGKLADKIFSPDNRQTPAIKNYDGVDCIPMPVWKSFLIQLLNIAGTGPIFGALMGAVFGPVVFFWIVFGSILGGAVHDYMVGMISCRYGGISIAKISNTYLGKYAGLIMHVFAVILLILVGTVFVTSPAALLAMLTPDFMDKTFWVIVILIYYFLATILPIDKIIGKLYPIFGLILIIMAMVIFYSIVFHNGHSIPEGFYNMHPENLPVWPFMFVTVACGAISGFHSTQSPMIAKCITSEKQGRMVFYGAMISEAVIALIWAAAGLSFYGSTSSLSNALADFGQSGVVYNISMGYLGLFGGILAVIGVVICPITSGDTAFRSARLILSEWIGLSQKNIRCRLVLAVPLLIIGAILTTIDFNILWRYFSWSNQTLAMIALWCAAIYLLKRNKVVLTSLIAAVPASFMSAVSLTYILMAGEGFGLSSSIAYPAGAAFALVLFIIYLICAGKQDKKNKEFLQNAAIDDEIRQ